MIRSFSRRAFVGLFLTAITAGCATRGAFVGVAPALTNTVRPILLVTNRVPGEAPLSFTDQRSPDLNYIALDISIPSVRQPGQINYPRYPVEPARHFAVAGAAVTSLAELPSTLASGANEELTVLVHGYNSTTAEAVYRHAQMAHDFGLSGPQVTFAWTSAASPVGYVHDRDAVAIARDDLERLIQQLSREQGRPIILLAHSMGALLVMETLRQMAISERMPGSLAGIVLISPDIDITLFRTQIERIGELPAPLIVFVSHADRALRLSARLSGQPDRLGSARDIRLLTTLGVSVIDLTAAEGGGRSGHFVAASSPDAIALIRGLQERGIEFASDEPVSLTLRSKEVTRDR